MNTGPDLLFADDVLHLGEERQKMIKGVFTHESLHQGFDTFYTFRKFWFGFTLQ